MSCYERGQINRTNQDTNGYKLVEIGRTQGVGKETELNFLFCSDVLTLYNEQALFVSNHRRSRQMSQKWAIKMCQGLAKLFRCVLDENGM